MFGCSVYFSELRIIWLIGFDNREQKIKKEDWYNSTIFFVYLVIKKKSSTPIAIDISN